MNIKNIFFLHLACYVSEQKSVSRPSVKSAELISLLTQLVIIQFYEAMGSHIPPVKKYIQALVQAFAAILRPSSSMGNGHCPCFQCAVLWDFDETFSQIYRST